MTTQLRNPVLPNDRNVIAICQILLDFVAPKWCHCGAFWLAPVSRIPLGSILDFLSLPDPVLARSTYYLFCQHSGLLHCPSQDNTCRRWPALV